MKYLPVHKQVIEWIKDAPSRILLVPVFIMIIILSAVLWIHGLLWPKYKKAGR